MSNEETVDSEAPQSTEAHGNDSTASAGTNEAVTGSGADYHDSATSARSEQTDEHAGAVFVGREKIAQLEHEVSLNQEKIDSLKNEYLRARADAENYRKRIEREKTEAIRFANSRILLDVINVLDNFERALIAVEKTEANSVLFDGVELIKKEWVSTLENNWGVREMETVKQSFDPQLHEAVAIEENEHATKAYVGEEFQKGYLLHSRVLRPAKVKVIKPTQGAV